MGGAGMGRGDEATHGYSPCDYDLEGDDLAFVPRHSFFVTCVLTSRPGRDYDGMF